MLPIKKHYIFAITIFSLILFGNYYLQNIHKANAYWNRTFETTYKILTPPPIPTPISTMQNSITKQLVHQSPKPTASPKLNKKSSVNNQLTSNTQNSRTTSSISSSPSPTTTPNISKTNVTIQSKVTFYGWNDNDPPGSAIAYPHSDYPQTLHNFGSGIGSFNNPLTLASDPTEFLIGTKIYIPFLKKYAILEDWCADCVNDWKSHQYHIDIWMNSNGSFANQLQSCENYWTKSSATVEVNPPSTREVSTNILFNTNNGTCLQ